MHFCALMKFRKSMKIDKIFEKFAISSIWFIFLAILTIFWSKMDPFWDRFSFDLLTFSFFFSMSRQQKSTFFYHIRNSATPWFFLKITWISFDFHQNILEIQFKIMINFVQFFAAEILIFSISEFRKMQKNTQKNVKESLRKKVTFFPKN